MESQAQVYEFLKLNGIPYECCEHAPVLTMEDCAALRLPAPHCKNLFLCNRARTQYHLLLLRAEKPFVTREVSRALGVSRLSFGDEAALLATLHTRPGAVSPMGLIFPEAAGVHLIVDEDLRGAPAIAFHPLTAGASLWMRGEDFFGRFLPLTGHTADFVKIS